MASNFSKVLADKRLPGKRPQPHQWEKLSPEERLEHTKRHLSLEEWFTAEESISRALIRLMIAYPFFGGMVVLMAAHRVWVAEEHQRRNGLEDFQTMATDGKRLYIHPQFALYMNQKELTGVLLHELFHNILQHPARGMGYLPQLANIAMDYAVNLMVNDAALESAGIDHKAQPMSSQSYDRVDWYVPVDAKIIDPRRPGDQAGFCIDERFRTAHGDPMQWEEIYHQLLEDLPSQTVTRLRGGGGDEGGASGLSQQELENALGHKMLDDHRMWRPEQRPPDEKGHVNRDKYDINVARDWFRSAEARIQGEMRGHIPAGILRRIRAFLEEPTPWPRLLTNYCQPMPADISWAPGDTRFNEPFPWFQMVPQLKYIMLGFDTSGSMSEVEIGSSIQDALGIIRSFPGTKGMALFWDAEVEEAIDIEQFKGRTEDADVKGGGGTCIRPQFEWVQAQGIEHQVQVFVVFTDGYVDWGAVDPDELTYDVIWVITNDHINVPEHPRYKETRLRIRK